MEKVGITTDTVSIGKNGTFLAGSGPMSDAEKAAMQKMMDETYEAFVAKAALGRKMDATKLEKLARGRVYTGRQAKALGLVDELGTLDDAIASARTLANIDASVETELKILPEPPSFFDSLLGPFGGSDRDAFAPKGAVALALPDAVRLPLQRLGQVLTLFSREPVVTIMPFELRIR